MIKVFVLLFLLIAPSILFGQLSDNDRDYLRAELANRINDLRISKGLKPLIVSDTLQEAATFHSKYMAKNDVLGHDERSSKYATPKKRVRAMGGKDFEVVGENVLYSSPQDFPLNKKELRALADEMFNSWKKSPGHYANMTEPEYVFGDLGFQTDTRKNIVYATQVFGTRGFVGEDQLSENGFGLTKADEGCEKAYQGFSNLVMNMGNNVANEDGELVLYYHDINFFKKIFEGPNDGIAVDLIREDQMACGRPNQLDLSPVYDGVLLKPVYSVEMLANNRAESDYRVITKIGEIPPALRDQDLSPAVILIKNGKACKYVYPAMVSRKDYDLRPFDPFLIDEANTELLEEGIVQSDVLTYHFKTNQSNAVKRPEINGKGKDVHSVSIHSYSSVEGDSVNNAKLHNARASYIKRHIQGSVKASDSLIDIDARENWELMNFQLLYFDREELVAQTHDSIKALLRSENNDLPWDSLLYAQREATAIVNYKGSFEDVKDDMSLEEFNLRTAVATDNPALANKVLYALYEEPFVLFSEDDPESGSLLFEPQIMAFMESHPETVTNYSALLSQFYYNNAFAVARYLHSWVKRVDELDNKSRSNLLHLYTLVGIHLLDNWDVSSKRLSNVIHPSKIEPMTPDDINDQLMLNLHLTFIQYFGQVNDGPNISKSFYFIRDYFKDRVLEPKDDVDLALFFNNWSMYNMAVEHLTSKFQSGNLNENGLFLLAETMNFTNSKDEAVIYLNVHKKALESNQSRWCKWLKNDFQVKRNYQIKRLYCESCN